MRYSPLFLPGSPAGFTLTEVMVAVVLLSITFLALAASGAIATRQLAADSRSLSALAGAQQRMERSAALPCASSAGIDSVNAVVVQWRTAETSSGVAGTTTSRYRTWYGDRIETYDFAAGCR